MQRFQTAFLIVLGVFSGLVSAQPYWVEVPMASRSEAAVTSAPGRYYQLDLTRLQALLDAAGLENGPGEAVEVLLPAADGSLRRFSVAESPILAPQIAARFPEFKTYKIHGLDVPGASGRLSLNPSGFRGMISDASGTRYIDSADGGLYRLYGRKSTMPAASFNCGVEGHDHAVVASDIAARLVRRTPGSFQTYRLAVAATAEYVLAVADGNQTLAFAEVNNAINRVNEIYERDLGIRLILSSGTNILYTNPASDPYSDNAPELLISQNQANLDNVNVVGNANYDIGHVFSTGGGGLAGVGVACDSGSKAQGVTGITNPVGDAFYIDYVAHEIGHQFGSDHSFNGTTRSCQGVQRAAATAYEPGSGSTIMAYAGICGAESIQVESDAVFHAGSIRQIDSYTTTGQGANCANPVSANNSREPVVNAGPDYTVPAQTPFQLSAAGSDANGDSLTYTWDQIDAGTSTTVETLGSDLGNNALFRSYLPREQNYRHFPALGTTLQNRYDRSEALACQARELNFRVTVRDQKSGIGRDDVRLTVDKNSGPFTVTGFDTGQSLAARQAVTLSWDVAGTNQAPVNCSQVDVSLLTFNANKTEYAETVLADNTPNTGSASFSLPDINSFRARFMVKCSTNIFYDVSNADLVITGGSQTVPNTKKVFYNSNGASNMFLSGRPDCPEVAQPSALVGGGSGGGAFGAGLAWCLLGLGLWRARTHQGRHFWRIIRL